MIKLRQPYLSTCLPICTWREGGVLVNNLPSCLVIGYNAWIPDATRKYVSRDAWYGIWERLLGVGQREGGAAV